MEIAGQLETERVTTREAALVALPFGVALATVVLTFWTVDIVSPALPDIKSDLHVSAATAGLIYSFLFLGRLLGNFPATYLLPRVGTAATATIGSIVLFAGALGAASAPSALWLTGARIGEGVGISLLVNGCLRAMLGLRPERGVAMTYFGFAATLGGVLGLQSGGMLTEQWGWRSVFVMSMFVAAVAVAATASMRIQRSGSPRAVDARRAEPAEGVQQSGSLTLALALNLLLFVNYSVFVALPLLTEHIFDTSSEVNAWLLMIITVAHLVASFPVGRLIRRSGAERALVGGMLVSLTGVALIVAAPSVIWLVGPLVIYGAGQLTCMNACGDTVLHLGAQGPRALGLLRFSSDLGLVIGPYLTGLLTDAFGYRAPFVALPIMMGVGVVFAAKQLRGARTVRMVAGA